MGAAAAKTQTADFNQSLDLKLKFDIIMLTHAMHTKHSPNLLVSQDPHIWRIFRINVSVTLLVIVKFPDYYYKPEKTDIHTIFLYRYKKVPIQPKTSHRPPCPGFDYVASPVDLMKTIV